MYVFTLSYHRANSSKITITTTTKVHSKLNGTYKSTFFKITECFLFSTENGLSSRRVCVYFLNHKEYK